jgi:ADP-ribose pyrophosphatase YjhB (NUDIX family)
MKKALMTAFRVLPPPLQRLAVRAGTPNFTVGAVVVLRRPDGRVLMVDQRHTGAWALPGGLLRRGEAPADGLVREVAEEVGVRLDDRELRVPLAVVAPAVGRVDVVYVVDTPDDRGAHAAAEDEVRRVGWFSLDELPEVTGPTHDILAVVRSV